MTGAGSSRPVLREMLADSQFDTQSGVTWRTLEDDSASTAVNSENENDFGGLARTAQTGHGIQKVGGSNPPGSTTPGSTTLSRISDLRRTVAPAAIA